MKKHIKRKILKLYNKCKVVKMNKINNYEFEKRFNRL